MQEDDFFDKNKKETSINGLPSENNEDPILLTHREVAEMLRISTNTLYRWNRTKKGPTRIKTAAGKVLYDKYKVLEFIRNSKS